MASQRKGLLLVTMQPPTAMEEEFHDWYDTEHVPERKNYPGFENAERWVCLDGWPRWLATYDLETTAALQSPQYLATNGANATAWTRRIVARLSGRRRVVAEQFAPGDESALPQDRISRLLVARYASDTIEVDVAALKANQPKPSQVRVFRAAGETWLLAAFDRPVVLSDLTAAYGTLARHGAAIFNLYMPYRRS